MSFGSDIIAADRRRHAQREERRAQTGQRAAWRLHLGALAQLTDASEIIGKLRDTRRELLAGLDSIAADIQNTVRETEGDPLETKLLVGRVYKRVMKLLANHRGT